MRFVIQKDLGVLDEENWFLKRILSSSSIKYLHSSTEISADNVKDFNWKLGEDIPIGSIEFVGNYLEKVKGSRIMTPLEVPECLRKDEYLKRKYEILPYQDLPKTGSYFIKDASVLKAWHPQEVFMPCFDDICCYDADYRSHDYVVSEVINILAEYRVFVCNTIIEGIKHYDGGCLVFPDSGLIKRMVNEITRARDFQGAKLPRSYTLDIAVTNRGTCVLEVHNFVACGTYGFNEDVLLYMYRDGVNFELER